MDKTILSPYLNFNGNCAEAMKFYQSVLGGKLDMQTFGDTKDMEVKESEKNNVIHAKLENDSIVIMASDGGEEHHITFGSSIHLNLNGSDEKTLTKYFDGLAEGGTADMPLAKQFWGDTFGMLTDKFGIHWMVNITSEK